MHIFVLSRINASAPLRKKIDNISNEDNVEKLKKRICSDIKEPEKETGKFTFYRPLATTTKGYMNLLWTLSEV